MSMSPTRFVTLTEFRSYRTTRRPLHVMAAPVAAIHGFLAASDAAWTDGTSAGAVQKASHDFSSFGGEVLKLPRPIAIKRPCASVISISALATARPAAINFAVAVKSELSAGRR
jgi:hypothetical protein